MLVLPNLIIDKNFYVDDKLISFDIGARKSIICGFRSVSLYADICNEIFELEILNDHNDYKEIIFLNSLEEVKAIKSYLENVDVWVWGVDDERIIVNV